MAGSPSKTQSLFPLETCPQVSDEAFNLFHSIDRELCTHLIHNLGRDPAESVQVMAFWMWLERESNDMNLVKKMLSLPLSLLNELANETMACLRCVESDTFQLGDRIGITLLPELLKSPLVTLQFFHENRITVLRGVSKVVSTVCVRAFSDIVQRARRGKAVANCSWSGVPASSMPERRVGAGMPPPILPIVYNPYVNVPFAPIPSPAAGGLIRMPRPTLTLPHVEVAYRPPAPEAVGLPGHMLAASGLPSYDLAVQHHVVTNEVGEMVSQNLTGTVNPINGGEGEEVPPDDRTIFLTFSKGYPTSEEEVREFFTKKFGDFIEDLIMQEVGEDEQVLYARMVAKTTGLINNIVGGSKAKYSINGKHVWARKYVKRVQSRSPPRGEASAAATSSSTN